MTRRKTLMPKRAAAWVARHILGTIGVEPASCLCQDAPSGHCEQGRHSACDEQAWSLPETYIARSTGVSLGDLAPVWLADRTCTRRCACPCHGVQLAFALDFSEDDA